MLTIVKLFTREWMYDCSLYHVVLLQLLHVLNYFIIKIEKSLKFFEVNYLFEFEIPTQILYNPSTLVNIFPHTLSSLFPQIIFGFPFHWEQNPRSSWELKFQDGLDLTTSSTSSQASPHPYSSFSSRSFLALFPNSWALVSSKAVSLLFHLVGTHFIFIHLTSLHIPFTMCLGSLKKIFKHANLLNTTKIHEVNSLSSFYKWRKWNIAKWNDLNKFIQVML